MNIWDCDNSCKFESKFSGNKKKLFRKFYFHFYHLPIAQGRVRFEASLRLGNASIFNTNEHGKRKLNLHYAALLEKYVSYLHLSYFNVCFHNTYLLLLTMVGCNRKENFLTTAIFMRRWKGTQSIFISDLNLK